MFIKFFFIVKKHIGMFTLYYLRLLTCFFFFLEKSPHHSFKANIKINYKTSKKKYQIQLYNTRNPHLYSYFVNIF